MKLFLLSTLAVGALNAGTCGDKKEGSVLGAKPSCSAAWLETRIAAQSAPGSTLGAVTEFKFRGQYVYAFSATPTVADGSTAVYRCDGSPLCSLGGIIGEVDCDGVRFEDSALSPRVLWRKKG